MATLLLYASTVHWSGWMALAGSTGILLVGTCSPEQLVGPVSAPLPEPDLDAALGIDPKRTDALGAIILVVASWVPAEDERGQAGLETILGALYTLGVTEVEMLAAVQEADRFIGDHLEDDDD